MHLAEKLTIAVRHNRYLERAEWLWDGVRPLYDRIVDFTAPKGLERVINGTDSILVSPKYRGVSEEYEPAVWRHLMSEVKSGDTVADIGAYIGLYTIALAKRVMSAGRVIAFEPNLVTFKALQEHVNLNFVADRVELIQAAVGAEGGRFPFKSQWSQSHIAPDNGSSNGHSVDCVTLDSVLGDKRLDLMKIDVEGYEEKVLQGAAQLLSDPERSPRAIYIEVHPHLWQPLGASSRSLLALLSNFGYRARYVNGSAVTRIKDYGEIVAHREL